MLFAPGFGTLYGLLEARSAWSVRTSNIQVRLAVVSDKNSIGCNPLEYPQIEAIAPSIHDTEHSQGSNVINI